MAVIMYHLNLYKIALSWTNIWKFHDVACTRQQNYLDNWCQNLVPDEMDTRCAWQKNEKSLFLYFAPAVWV